MTSTSYPGSRITGVVVALLLTGLLTGVVACRGGDGGVNTASTDSTTLASTATYVGREACASLIDLS